MFLGFLPGGLCISIFLLLEISYTLLPNECLGLRTVTRFRGNPWLDCRNKNRRAPLKMETVCGRCKTKVRLINKVKVVDLKYNLLGITLAAVTNNTWNDSRNILITNWTRMWSSSKYFVYKMIILLEYIFIMKLY